MLTCSLLSLSAALAAAPDDTFPIGDGRSVRYGDLVAANLAIGRSGRVLVAADGSDPSVEATLRARWPGLEVTPLPGGLLRVTPPPGGDDLALTRAIDALPGVEFALPDLIVPLAPTRIPADAYYGGQWHLENTGQSGIVDVDIDASLAWDFATGAGQLIAILDTGTQPDHPDLRVTLGYDYVGRDDDSSPDYNDAYGGPHGTGTAGIAAASGDNGIGVAGVAFDADIYAIRLIGGLTSYEDLYNAFVEAVDVGATVLSNSWGYGTCSPVPSVTLYDFMFRHAETKGRGGLGSAVVFSAGNEGCDVSDNGMLTHDTLVVVAALESNDVRAGYSSFGDPVDIAAPTSILTTDWTSGGYGSHEGDDGYYPYFSGTSASAPVVAGVFALMFEANPRLTAADAREVVCRTATKVDLSGATYDADGWHPYYGCGRVNAGAAVAAVANAAPGAPVVAEPSRIVPGPAHLTWMAPTDPDGDALTYVVRWSVEGPDPEPGEGWPAPSTPPDPDEAPTSGEVYVTGELFVPPASFVDGDVISYTVAAVDTWGEGPRSRHGTIVVVATSEPDDTAGAPTDTGDGPAPPPEDPPQTRGCASAPAAPTALVAALAAALLRTRRGSR
jgi:subtilisin family serine protease